MRHKEIEFKYNANNIKLETFLKELKSLFNIDLNLVKYGYGKDYYFNNDDPFIFLRCRECNNFDELTVKKKTNSENSWDRVEVDLKLDRNNFKFKDITKFAELLGYTYAFELTKKYCIAKTKELSFSYYSVNGDKYIEIEAEKETFDSESTAIDRVIEAESKLSKLGLSKNTRLTQSLFEIFREKLNV